MRYAVMDLEFNQPFDFTKGTKTTPNEKCPFEIIQIGLVLLSENFSTISKSNILVKPQLYPRMHPYVEKITGLKMETLENQKTFPEAYKELLPVISGEDVVLCVWGNSDIKLLYKNIVFYGLDHNELTKKYVNVQSIASKFLNLSAGNQLGLKNAVDLLALPVESTFHDALNDAAYTSEILRVLDVENLTVETFNVDDLFKEKQATQYDFNVKNLLADSERFLGRKLSKKEKNVIKKIYMLGRLRKYDVY